MAVDSPIGLFDSGLGGLTVLRELKRMLPNEQFVYLGDSARTPYGNKGTSTIIRYARECTHYLLEREIKLLVVACNTASAAALHVLKSEVPCPVIGTIDPAVRAALSAGGPIGVIGTEATIESGAYQRRIAELSPTTVVQAKQCPLFVPLVEQGMFDGEIVDKVAELYLSELRAAHISSLILGCTHYPLLARTIRRYFGDEVAVIECSKAIAEDVRSILEERGLLRTAPSAIPDRFFVTDAPRRFDLLASILLDGGKVESTNVGALKE